ncbi:MAG: TetR/AcrR family transcriptional regulator [Lachnospiraceae bacterium]|jgi:AcrR family transcriptional regulator|nr:TetR/AcrR family transcriptional regulator [Lachnospiraceae bacterium]
MTEPERAQLKRNNAALFINTTQEMMDSEGMANLSIRKVADKTGFHNSTIYLYFNDFDELLLLASMKHFKEYAHALGELSKKDYCATQLFLLVWEHFCDSCFKYPDIFYNFFYGKRSNDIESIMKKYYSIFPDELSTFSPEIESMYFGNNHSERSFMMLKPLINEDTSVTQDNVNMINDVIIGHCKYILEQLCEDESKDCEHTKAEFIKMLKHICGINAAF